MILSAVPRARPRVAPLGSMWPAWLPRRRRSPDIVILKADDGRQNRGPEARDDAALRTLRNPLLNAYAASLLDIASYGEGLQTGRLHAALEPVHIATLVTEVIDALSATALSAGLRLIQEADGDATLCTADPQLLQVVLRHTLLRALSLEPVPGHVRVSTARRAGEAQIILLSRSSELAERGAELATAQRVLCATRGSLVLEPRRGGYLPLTIALRADTLAQREAN